MSQAIITNRSLSELTTSVREMSDSTSTANDIHSEQKRTSQTRSKAEGKKPTKSKRMQNHRRPTIPIMIDEAIFEKTRYGKGLSLVAVKKHLQENYGVNLKFAARKIREYIKESVDNGRYIRKTGRGANGSFSLAAKVRKQLNSSAVVKSSSQRKSNGKVFKAKSP